MNIIRRDWLAAVVLGLTLTLPAIPVIAQSLTAPAPTADQQSMNEMGRASSEKLSAAPSTVPRESGVTDVQKSEPAASEKRTIGLSVGLEISSAYVFRGLNLFQSDGQMDQHALVAPSIGYAFGDTGVNLGYWAAYQWTGSNRDELVHSGIGAEQDLILGWSRGFIEDSLSLSTALVYYFYPFATEAEAGCVLPSYLEPGVALTYSGPIDIGLSLSYFAGLQDALADFRYFSVRPMVSKKIGLTDHVSASAAISAGYKLFNDYDSITDNVWDVQIDWKLPIEVGGFAVEPGLHGSWTNLEEESFGDEYIIWANIASTLGI
jgi:hypothetical protein